MLAVVQLTIHNHGVRTNYITLVLFRFENEYNRL